MHYLAARFTLEIELHQATRSYAEIGKKQQAELNSSYRRSNMVIQDLVFF